jgi:hypothetical protein
MTGLPFSYPGNGLSARTRQAKMADIVYHSPVLPTQPTHANSNEKTNGYFQRSSGPIPVHGKGTALIVREKRLSEI